MSDVIPKLRLNKAGHFVIGNWDDETYRDISPRLSMQKKYKDEIIHRCDCHDDLVAVCEDALVGIPEGIVTLERGYRKKGQKILTKTFRNIEAALDKVKKS